MNDKHKISYNSTGKNSSTKSNNSGSNSNNNTNMIIMSVTGISSNLREDDTESHRSNGISVCPSMPGIFLGRRRFSGFRA